MIRTQHRAPASTDVDPDYNELNPEQVLTGVALLIGFALAMGLVYALIDALF